MGDRRTTGRSMRAALAGAARRDRSKDSVQLQRPGSPVNEDDVFTSIFADMDGFEGQDPGFEGAGPSQEKKMDADFFNAFGDIFDEDDMKPGK